MAEAQALLLDPGRALPPRVWCISLWWKWAALVAAGIKTIETRHWEWPYGPSWLAIHASQRPDGTVAGRSCPLPEAPPVQPGALCALVWVEGCRELLPEDEPRALCYAPGRFAWPLSDVRRLAPVPMRGPQKLARVDRAIIEQALARIA